MERPAFLTGLTRFQMRLIEVCRSLAADDRVFVSVADILRVIAVHDWGMDEEGFEEECEELGSEVRPIDAYDEETVGYAYRTLLNMGLPWRNRYPYFDLSGMMGDFHDEVPFGPESVEARLTQNTHILFPLQKKPLLPVALLNGVTLSDGAEVPPHHVEELWMAMEQVRQDPDVALDDLMEILPGPDFGAGGVVGGFEAIRALYEKGEGVLTLRGKIETIIDGGRTRIEIQSLPHGILINAILRQIRALKDSGRLPAFLLKDYSEGKTPRIVMDMPPEISVDALKTILYQETDLERSVYFRCGFQDDHGWTVEGPLIAVLKEAVAQCPSGWKQKNGNAIAFVPFFREIMRHGGYKNPLSKLSDERKTAVTKMVSL